MADAFANGRSILHKGDGNTHVAAPPDVCKVPTPGGPVPTPFVNSAQDSMLAKGSKTTQIEGNSVVLADSELSTSSGDEPGTAGGLISSKFKGKMTWSGSSMDVKVEGKGVVRFLDPTLHNGNTFNTSFASNGRTGLAYGDDAKCELCKKPLDNHRVHETTEVTESVDKIFFELAKRFKDQKPLIDDYLRLRNERKDIEGKSTREVDAMQRALNSDEERAKELIAAGPAANPSLREELGQLQERLKLAKNEIKEKRARDRQKCQELTRQMDAINLRLEGMQPVMRKDESLHTYVLGYMVGVCICKCPHEPKMLATCSGEAPPGFVAAVAATPFTRVESFQMSDRQQQAVDQMKRKSWECAGPKLLQAGGAGGHKVKTMSERYYSPARPITVTVKYEHTDHTGTRNEPQEFGHGESVPSCEACQQLLPEMLCDNDKECA